MTTTELIKILTRIEHGASGRSREISFTVPTKDNKDTYFLYEPEIILDGTGDGIAGAEVSFKLLIKQ